MIFSVTQKNGNTATFWGPSDRGDLNLAVKGLAAEKLRDQAVGVAIGSVFVAIACGILIASGHEYSVPLLAFATTVAVGATCYALANASAFRKATKKINVQRENHVVVRLTDRVYDVLRMQLLVDHDLDLTTLLSASDAVVYDDLMVSYIGEGSALVSQYNKVVDRPAKLEFHHTLVELARTTANALAERYAAQHR